MAPRPLNAFLALLLLAGSALAQRPHPASWTLTPESARIAPGGSFLAELEVTLQDPWHMYSMTTPAGGPIITTISVEDNPAIASWTIFQPPAKRKFDPNFGIETDTYGGSAKFLVRLHVAEDAPAGLLEFATRMRYQLCTDTECLPPRPMTATAQIEVAADGQREAGPVPANYSEFRKGEPGPLAAPAQSAPSGTQGLGAFVLVAFALGFAAVFTPCVFPMIPITISFFLNQGAGSRGEALKQAIVFSLGIIFLFTALGFGLTAALGPFAVVQLAANPWVNLAISTIFFIFALSLLGAFEITLPSGLLTKLNAASSQGGTLGTLLMGLTFSLTAFACVGPFVGTLLAASVQGGGLQPVLGMLFFGSGLALPFFFLALFPGYLQRLPRSGAWMARVKVVMGFLVLAAMLYYLSRVDLVWGWELLTRERFLAFWVLFFALPGLYLLGFLRMEGIKPDAPVTAGRLLVGTLFLMFSISLIPGIFGAKMGELEPFLPAASQNAGFAGAGAGAPGAKWIKDDYPAALAEAREAGKPLLVSFTGYACTNCKWMKRNLFTRTEVAQALDRFVLLELYTDGTDAASEENQKRQEGEYQTVAIPFYAIVDGSEQTRATFAGLTRDSNEFLGFLAKAD
ncbi:MAG: thioredoxin family protein [Bryobacteraceae bacterium]|nr:thioredoxin family protein [Bryobacteraceae bacterium]